MKKRFLLVLLLTLWVGTAFAGPPSLLGGKPMGEGTAHMVGIGWPGLTYEWWHAGAVDWAIGGELVYGDWSAGFSDVTFGGAVNVPVRWYLGKVGAGEMAFQVKPGILFANVDTRWDDYFVFGLRGELGLPVTIDLTPEVNLITGASIPFTVMIVDGADDFVILPLLARIGTEVKATERITPWLLFELGPALSFGGYDGTEAEFAFRIWVGSAFK